MPYTMQTAPVKDVLPVAALRIWVSTFNAVFAENGDDNVARQAAWAQVKRSYKKEGDKWVPKES